MEKEKYWKREFNRCINGCTIKGRKLSGQHYFYLNYIKINDKVPEYRPKNNHFFNRIIKLERTFGRIR